MTEANDFAGLRALFVNCTLERQPTESHTQLLLNASGHIMANRGMEVDHLHLLSHVVPHGIYPDMTEHGWERDDWPALWERVAAANILVLGTPIWLGEESSVARVLIERLYAMSAKLNDKGQSVFYGKTAGVVVTGNEDGIKHVAAGMSFALNHIGYTIPPQADCGWIGPVGPGPSFGDDDGKGGRVGFDSDFTQRNCSIMTWNLMHLARMLASGIPTMGNDRNAWAAGERFGFALPEARG